jgi:multidrug efflux pump subunit AcrA (membrane-fusion protein)
VADKDGTHTKKPVVVGKKADRRVEILEGLKEGDEILTDKPGAKKPDGPSKEPNKEVKP